MALKRKLHHVLVVIRRVKTWQLVIILIFFAAMAAFLLRQNNLQMVALRNAVTQADAQNGDTKTALLNLQKYVSAHMNTDLGGGIYLQNAYERDYQAIVQAAATAVNPQAALYAQVEAECQPVFRSTHSFPAYTQCAHDKLSQLAPGQDPLANLKTPNAELYHYNFASPIISFDPAGFFVLFTFAVTVVLLAKLLTYFALFLVIRHKKARI